MGGAFEAAFELLDVHPQLPGEAPLAARCTTWRMAIFYAYISGSSVEINDGKQRERPR